MTTMGALDFFMVFLALAAQGVILYYMRKMLDEAQAMIDESKHTADRAYSVNKRGEELMNAMTLIIDRLNDRNRVR